MRWMRPRGESISSLPEDVRRARREAEPAVDAVGGELGDHPPRVPVGSKARRTLSWSGPSASSSGSELTGTSSRLYATPALGRTTASESPSRTSPSSPGENRSRPRADCLPRRATPARRRVRHRVPPKRPAPLRAERRPRAASPRRARRPGRDGGRRARSARAASGAALRPRVAVSPVSTTSVLAACGSGCRRKLDARDQREPPLRAADEATEVVARDVLHDLPACARDRPVREHERHAEDEVAGCAEAMPERARRRSSPAARRSSGRRAGRARVAGRGSRAPRSASDSRTPASTVQVRSPASCSRIRSSAVGRQVVADAQPRGPRRSPRPGAPRPPRG